MPKKVDPELRPEPSGFLDRDPGRLSTANLGLSAPAPQRLERGDPPAA
ncbi:hypothetical protein [Streptomyces sp. NPDC005760]